ncbi:MAG: SRPBCC domain-containing protein [Ferruginibacter sp.]
MHTEPIIIERSLNASMEKVWKAISDKDAMKEWYFDIAEFEPEPGFEFQFHGKGKEGEDYLHLCKVIEAIQGKKLSYTWRYDGYEGNSLVTFELFAEGEYTKLRLTHHGLETFPAGSNAFARENFVEGWNFISGTALPGYLEK